jgi:hypothetical protein
MLQIWLLMFPGKNLTPCNKEPAVSYCPRHRHCWAMGTNKVKMCAVRKILFCTELTSQDKNLLYGHDEPNEPTKEGGGGPFICTSRVPICLSFKFNSHQGPPLSGLFVQYLLIQRLFLLLSKANIYLKMFSNKKCLRDTNSVWRLFLKNDCLFGLVCNWLSCVLNRNNRKN